MNAIARLNARDALAGRPEQAASRDWFNAILRGFRGRCPNCGEGALYRRFLKVNRCCPACGEELFHERSDDAAPYLTIAVVGHIVVGGILSLEMAFHPLLWVQLAVWLPVTALAALALLPRVKGAVIDLQWALRMHGFGDEKEIVG